MSRLRIVAALGMALLAGCTPATAPINPVTVKEQTAADTLKTQYKDVVTGTDVKNTTLNVYIDVDNMDSMDESAEAAMKADALQRWTRIWKAAHPHKHATVHLSLRDYYGKEIYAASARV